MVKTRRRVRPTCARNLRDLAAEGDIIICMGAGDITKWAAGLATASPRRGSKSRSRKREGQARSAEVRACASADTPPTPPNVRGKLKADAPLAPLVWFKSGGNAELAVRAGRSR